MRWLKVQVRVRPEAEEAVAELLRAAGAQGVWLEEDGASERALSAYFPESRQGPTDDVARQVQELTQFGLDVGSGRVTTEWVSDEDWAENWKRDYRPLRLGQRLLIKPAWLPDPPDAAGRVVVELDPGMAFGTGYHPTTALCLVALDEFVRPGDVVADVGAGSGILAIAAARLGAGRVVAVDTLPETVPVAAENCRRNGVEDVVTVAQGSADVALGLLRGGAQSPGDGIAGGTHESLADLVVVNILARIIRRLAPELATLLKPGGLFIFSGVIEHAAEELADHVREFGLDVTDIRYDAEWACLVGRRRS